MNSFLQSKEWLDFQESVGRKVWRFDDGGIKANVIKHDLPFGRSYLYIPHGPEIYFDNIGGGIKNKIAKFTDFLRKLASEEKAIFIKAEPLTDVVIELIYRRGFRRSLGNIQPRRTALISLNLPVDEILGRMHHKTRYNIRIAEKHGIKVELGGDIEAFLRLLDKTSKRDNFSMHPKNYYKKMFDFLGDRGEIKTDLIMASNNSKAVAGAVVLRYRDTGYYLHGASDYRFRSLMAPYALHWEIVKYLKDRGLRYYDFWGVDSRKWPGVTRFKLGWGGDLVEHPGSFDLPVSRPWYLAYKLTRRVL